MKSSCKDGEITQKMKYRVGDRVKVKQNLQINKEYDEWLFTKEMNLEYVTIESIEKNSYSVKENNYNYTEEMLDKLYKDNQLVEVNIFGRALRIGEIWEDFESETFMAYPKTSCENSEMTMYLVSLYNIDGGQFIEAVYNIGFLDGEVLKVKLLIDYDKASVKEYEILEEIA